MPSAPIVPYAYDKLISLRDTDAAGVVFFAHHLGIAHEAYEAFLDSVGLNVGEIIREGHYALPVVHVDADYRAPLYCGQRCAVTLRVAELRSRAYTVAYELRTPDGALASAIRTTHAAVDLHKKTAVPLPAKLREALKTLLLPNRS